MRWRPVRTCVPLVVALASCGKFLGEDGEDATPAAPAPDAPAPDATDDVATATGDGGSQADAACPPDAILCQDFDRADAGVLGDDRGGWVEDDNVVAIVPEGRSLPNAVEARGNSGGLAAAIHYFDVMPLAPAKIRFSVWFRIASSSRPTTYIAFIWSRPDRFRHGVKAFVNYEGKAFLEEFAGLPGEGYRGAQGGAPVDTGNGWHQIEVEVDWATKRAALSYDGRRDVATLALFNGYLEGRGSIDLGAYEFGGNTQERRALLDDVVVRPF